MARPRKIVDCNDLKRHIDAYFESIDSYNNNPDNIVKKYYTWPDLLIFLDVTPKTIENWKSNGESFPGYQEVIEKACLRLQSQMESLGLSDGKKTGMVAFMLKQNHYGGYTDKPVSAADSINVKVTLEGTGHKDAFG